MTVPVPDDTGTDDRALRHGTAAVRLARDVVSVTGPDAESYLQGQCSQDVASLDAGGHAEALLLSPQGKLDALVRVTRLAADSFVLDMDAGTAGDVRARLERFRLRTKVDIDDLDWSCVALRGAGLGPAPAPTGSGLPPWLAVDSPPMLGFDLLGPVDDVEAAVPAGVRWCNPSSYEVLRIEAGLPRMGVDISESTIAAEAGLVERTVSFTKGCFTGQELVARLDARGSRVARRLVGAVVAGGDRGDAYALVDAEVIDPGDGSPAGTVTSAAWAPSRGAVVALATVHRRVEVPGRAVLRAPDGAGYDAELAALPLT